MQDLDTLNNDFIAMLERAIQRLRAMLAVGYSNCQLDQSSEPNRSHTQTTNPELVGVQIGY